MHILVSDETCTKNKNKERMFIYAGLIMSDIYLQKASNFLIELKRENGIAQEIEIKWSLEDCLEKFNQYSMANNQNPIIAGSIEHKDFEVKYNSIKEAILDFVSQNKEIKISAIIRPIDLLGLDYGRCIKFSFRKMLEDFEDLLRAYKDLGIVATDDILEGNKNSIEPGDAIKLLADGTKFKQFKKIILIIPNTNSVISPAHQINDIVIGCFQNYLYHLIMYLSDNQHDYSLQKRLVKKIIKNFCMSTSHSPLKVEKILGKGIKFEPSTSQTTNIRTRLVSSIKNQLISDLNE